MDRFYFDHNATTPVAPEVVEALVPCLGEVYGNASSIHHYGQAAKQRLETARRQVATLIGARADEIVFTSGGTEADNLALFGTVRACGKPNPHIVTTAIEHPAVLNSCAALEREGVTVTYVPVGEGGVVDPDDLRRALRPETVLVSVMLANNELGTLQPVGEIAKMAHDAGAYFHTDAVQAVGKVGVDVAKLGVDLLSLSGHKIYAPKGIGALYVHKSTRLTKIQFGGHHERDRRSGTENVPGAVALGRACDLSDAMLDTESKRLLTLRDRLEAGIVERIPATTVNGRATPRTVNTSSISIEGIDGEAMLIALDLAGFAVSSGAACSSGAAEPSHVLTAIGLSRDRARSTLRFSLGRANTEAQVDALVEAVARATKRLRQLSPTYTSHV